MSTFLRKEVSEHYNKKGIMSLTVYNGYKFFFYIKEDNGFDRDKRQVLAIMENQYRELGELIKIVKEKY